MPDVTLTPAAAPFHATLAPPGSKSLTNRALILAALAGGESVLTNALAADDTAVMLDGLGRLGFDLAVDGAAKTVRVNGLAGEIPSRSADLFCGNSGTTIRFLTALCSLGHGTFHLDGVPRMRQRPVGPLLELLKNLGVRVASVESNNCPPLRLDADGLPGGLAFFGPESSSQFLSAALMVAPHARHEVQISLGRPQTSWPYVEMTLRLMDHFGHTAELIRDPLTRDPLKVIVPQGTYAATEYAVEPDASAASYFLAAAAISQSSTVTISGLGSDSLQGDVKFADVLKKMGPAVEVRRDSITVTGTGELDGIDVDLSGMPDVAQTLAVVACFASDPSTLRGLHTLRVKETDRLAALEAELTKLGATAFIEADALTIRPPAQVQAAAIDTYDDHRMAMSFAVAGTRAEGITIRDAGCVNKTYPTFFRDLEKAILS